MKRIGYLCGLTCVILFMMGTIGMLSWTDQKRAEERKQEERADLHRLVNAFEAVEPGMMRAYYTQQEEEKKQKEIQQLEAKAKQFEEIAALRQQLKALMPKVDAVTAKIEVVDDIGELEKLQAELKDLKTKGNGIIQQIIAKEELLNPEFKNNHGPQEWFIRDDLNRRGDSLPAPGQILHIDTSPIDVFLGERSKTSLDELIASEVLPQPKKP